MHVAIDDHSRLAFAAMYPDLTERGFTHFLAISVPWYEGFGIRIRRVLTDNRATRPIGSPTPAAKSA
jgi:hypothetical protein